MSVIKREKRILWLINHTTLRAAEVPLLLSLGYEVYTPKCFPVDEANLSASIDFSYDASLTIPIDLLNELNRQDFYSQPLSEKLCGSLNEYFGIVICAFFPSMLSEFVLKFAGRVLLRVFGLGSPATYASLLETYCGATVIERIKQMGDRFWLAQAYSQLEEVEPAWLRQQAVTLPLGMPPAAFTSQDTWNGADLRIFFVCPRIGSSPAYYGRIYSVFKAVFGDLPHLIAGRQPVSVDDCHVTGFLEDAVFSALLSACRVMFYHSQEPRHLHYHPLEAIAAGMPVIYLKGGLLARLSTGQQPGECASYMEAREKIIRILQGDTELINQVRSSQRLLLESFKPEVIHAEWQKNFVERVNS